MNDLSDDAAAKPRRGRRPRLSRAAVVEAALDVLQSEPAADFTLGRVAARLGATTMSLYTYFPSREVLLDAVAEEVLTRFKRPPPQPDWRATVMAWLWALNDLFQSYPVAEKVLASDRRVPIAWLQLWIPVVQALAALDLSREELGRLFSAFINAAVGLIIASRSTPPRDWVSPEWSDERLAPPERELLAALWDVMLAVEPVERLQIGFNWLVAGLEADIRRVAAEDRGGRGPSSE